MIKYRKAREIIDQVADDFGSYDDQGLMDYSKFYKVIRQCNALLGEKINPEKGTVIPVHNYRGRLPDDFSNLNYALLCTQRKVNVAPPSGFQVEYKTLCERTGNSCNPCVRECDNEYVIVQKCNEKWEEFSKLEVVRVSTRSFKHCGERCPNFFTSCTKVIDIGDDGLITTNFEKGDLYFNYIGSMEDEDGDLLVLDHEMVEPFYEASILTRMLKLIAYNKEGDVAEIYRDSKIDLGRARTQAISFVSLSGYEEIKDLFQSQRERLYNKYFSPII